MAFTRLRMLILLMTLSAAAITEDSQRFLRLPVSKSKHSTGSSLDRRQDPIEVSLLHRSSYRLYEVQIPVGTPPQEMRLALDTESSDVWMPTREVCDPSTGCEPFDCSSSSTCKLLRSYPDFHIGYVDGRGAQGAYISENVHFGNMVIREQTLGLVNTTLQTFEVGMMGIGPASRESIVANRHQRAYPSLLDSMAKQGIIESKAFSLHLDSLDSDNGSIVFGGYEENKFIHPLYIVPIIPRNGDGRYAVELSSISITGFGGSQNFKSSWMPAQVLLDSGFSTTWLPSDVVDAIAGYFQATPVLFPGGNWHRFQVACSQRQQNGTLDFKFAGPAGPTISVPASELITPPLDDRQCYMTIGKAQERGFNFTLGDTFLRSAYVTYDLSNNAIGIAQAVSNVNEPSSQSFGVYGVFGVSGAVDMSQAFPATLLPSKEWSPAEAEDSAQLTQCNAGGSIAEVLSGKIWIIVTAATMASSCGSLLGFVA